MYTWYFIHLLHHLETGFLPPLGSGSASASSLVTDVLWKEPDVLCCCPVKIHSLSSYQLWQANTWLQRPQPRCLFILLSSWPRTDFFKNCCRTQPCYSSSVGKNKLLSPPWTLTMDFFRCHRIRLSQAGWPGKHDFRSWKRCSNVETILFCLL